MYHWSVYIHVIIAAFWIGGMLFTAAVLVPATRRRLAAHKGLLFTELGTRFSRISWALFPLLILTGITALFGKGYRIVHLVDPVFWSSDYGMLLAHKMGLFAIVLILSGLHDFWYGKKAAEWMIIHPDHPLTDRYRTTSKWIGRINLLFGLVILFLAVSLIR